MEQTILMDASINIDTPLQKLSSQNWPQKYSLWTIHNDETRKEGYIEETMLKKSVRNSLCSILRRSFSDITFPMFVMFKSSCIGFNSSLVEKNPDGIGFIAMKWLRSMEIVQYLVKKTYTFYRFLYKGLGLNLYYYVRDICVTIISYDCGKQVLA